MNETTPEKITMMSTLGDIAKLLHESRGELMWHRKQAVYAPQAATQLRVACRLLCANDGVGPSIEVMGEGPSEVFALIACMNELLARRERLQANHNASAMSESNGYGSQSPATPAACDANTLKALADVNNALVPAVQLANDLREGIDGVNVASVVDAQEGLRKATKLLKRVQAEVEAAVDPSDASMTTETRMSRTMKPTIANARLAAEAFNARQVVVVAFDYAGRYAVVSYGVTKDECEEVARLCDAIAAGLDDGSLLPEFDS